MRKLRSKSSTNQGQGGLDSIILKKAKSASNSSLTNSSIGKRASTMAPFQHMPLHEGVKYISGTPDQSYSEYNLHQIKNFTTDFGIKQNGSELGLNVYSLDDNAMALVILCEHYELTREKRNLELIEIYLNFIEYCLQPTGYFFKYVDAEKKFTQENETTNLADTTGCALWALGYLISKKNMFPSTIVEKAEAMFQTALQGVKKIYSTRAIAYIIKGLHYYNTKNETIEAVWLIKKLGDQLVTLYKETENNQWKWFQQTVSIESSLIAEALLCAWKTTGVPAYREISKTSFDFLLSKIFNNEVDAIHEEEKMFERKKSMDVNTFIFALNSFYKVFKEEEYLLRIKRASEWQKWNKFMQF